MRLLAPVVLLVASAFLPGCGSSKKPESEDLALTVDEYVKRGVPAPDKTWGVADLQKAKITLAAIAAEDRHQLPRTVGKSASVFARLISADYLAIGKDKALPLKVRQEESFAFMKATGDLLKLYVPAATVYPAEVIELSGASMRLIAVQCDLLGELLPTLDPADPKFPVRMEGLKGTKHGLATLLSATLIMLTERGAYSEEQRLKLLGYMEETFPKIVPRLNATDRADIAARLEEMSRDSAFESLKAGLLKLHKLALS